MVVHEVKESHVQDWPHPGTVPWPLCLCAAMAVGQKASYCNGMAKGNKAWREIIDCQWS